MGWTYRLSELAAVIGAERPAFDGDFSSISTDTRTIARGQVFFALSGDRFDGNRFVTEAFEKGAVAAVSREPSGAGPTLVVDAPLAALQTFAAHHRNRYSIPLLALTGSCGKTSTKELLATLLGTKYRVIKTQGNLNNDIGCPMSLLQIDRETEFAVIEMGANHVGEIAQLCRLARPTESAITLVAPAHLEGFGSVENVAKAKGEIAHGLQADGTFYVNLDNVWCRAIGDAFPGRKVTFGRTGDVALESCVIDDRGEIRLRIRPLGELRLPLQVPAYTTNVLLAVAVGLEHGIETFEEPLREACRNSVRFRVSNLGPLTVIDDTYNANPASVAASLEALAARGGGGARFAALGDMLELGATSTSMHRDVGTLAAKLGITKLFAYGPEGRHTVESALEGGIDGEWFDSHEALAEAVARVAKAGDALLVKGSRGMKMEGVITALEKLYA